MNLDLAIRTLSNELKVPLVELYRALTQYMYAQGVADVVMSVLGFVFIIISGFILFKLLNRKNMDEWQVIVSFVLGIITLVILFASCSGLHNGIVKINAPEGAGIMKLLGK